MRYSVAADTRGMVTCGKCKTQFSASYDGNSTDKKTAIRALVIGALTIVVLGVIIVGLGGKKAPGTPTKKPQESSGNYDIGAPRSPSSTSSTSSDPVEQVKIYSKQPPIVTKKFLQAMVDQDRATLEQLFLFDDYFKGVAEKYKWDESQKYANLSPEDQATRRAEQVERLLHEETRLWLERSLLPAIEAGTATIKSQSLDYEFAYYEYEVVDSQQKPLFNIRISLGLRDGMTAAADGQREEAWGVKQVAQQWHTTAVGVSKPDKRAVDMGEGRVWKEEAHARAANPSGFVESEAFMITPPSSIPADLVGKIEALIKTATDPNATVEGNRARDELETIGAPAIPFLLNALVGKNHADSESDILACMGAIDPLKRITGLQFGYGPPAAADPVSGEIAGATPEQRATAIRGWFGWWKTKGRSFKAKAIAEEDKEPEFDPKRPWKKRVKN